MGEPFEEVEKCLQEERFDDAIRLTEASQVKNYYRDYLLATAYQRKAVRQKSKKAEDYEKAIQLYTSSIEQNPSFADAFLMRGMARMSSSVGYTGDIGTIINILTTAEHDFQTCLQIDPTLTNATLPMLDCAQMMKAKLAKPSLSRALRSVFAKLRKSFRT